MFGTFLESQDDPHVALRDSLLGFKPLPPPDAPVVAISSTSLLSGSLSLVEASLRSLGLAIVQLDEPLPMQAFEHFARHFGELVPERDPAVRPHVELGALLHLRTSFGPTGIVSLQPFSSGFLTMHSESSGHALVDQPRYIALQCVAPGDRDSAPQTVLVRMSSVASALSERTKDILSHTRYHGQHASPYILRRDGEPWVLSIRDFHRQSLAWVHDGPFAGDAVQDALRQLLAAMYSAPDTCAVQWSRGLLVVLDNQRFLHARGEGRFLPGRPGRHLIRARMLGSNAARPVCSPSPAAAPVMQRPPGLFDRPLRPRRPAPAIESRAMSPDNGTPPRQEATDVFVDDRVLDLFARARNPDNAAELHELWLGRLEAESGAQALRPELGAVWRSSRVRRTVGADEVLASNATVGLVKSLFNTYFRDDLYGALAAQRQIVLSSGAVDEVSYGLPECLKETLRYALERDWYGYSDSRGREAARLAVADLESARISGAGYTAEHVVLTLGATQAIAALADFLLHGRSSADAALCAIPNYPPLVQSIARRHPVRLVPTPSRDSVSSLAQLAGTLTPNTPLVLLQTGTNPCGSVIDEHELERFIEAASPATTIVLDECHEWLGPARRFSPARRRSNVVRISSLSKEWSVPGLKVGWFLADPALVNGYYEHASTGYGGPASLTYTLVEVLARFERWRHVGTDRAGPAELSEFSGDYGLRIDTLAKAYSAYCAERTSREIGLSRQRDEAWHRLTQARVRVCRPRCSINLLAEWPGLDDSYRAFRQILRDTGVSLYPGVLAFRLSGACLRLTTSRPWPELDEGLGRLCRWSADTVATRTMVETLP